MAKTHGKSSAPEYNVWRNMRARCRNRINYADRGITVCERWDDFSVFLSDMGPRPTDKHTIERIDNSAGYTPDNCIWADRKTQNTNKRDTTLITYNGETLCASDWSRRLGGEISLVKSRLAEGWGIEDAVTTTAGKRTKSAIPGVHRFRDKWQAKITRNKVVTHLGTFDSFEDAAKARKEAESLHQ